MAKKFDPVLIAHADRAWQAEVTNAERVTKERHLALTLIVAFLGVGLFKADWLHFVLSHLRAGGLPQIVVAAFLITATAFLVGALVALAQQPNGISASARLDLPVKAYDPPGVLTADQQRRLAFARTYRAYQELQSRNERSRARLGLAWLLFGVGIALVGAAIVIYVVDDFRALTHPETVTHDRDERLGEAPSAGSPNIHAP